MLGLLLVAAGFLLMLAYDNAPASARVAVVATAVMGAALVLLSVTGLATLLINESPITRTEPGIAEYLDRLSSLVLGAGALGLTWNGLRRQEPHVQVESDE
jgi:hypothetical protein